MQLRLLEDYKSLLRLGLPLLVTQMGVIVVSFADTMMVGSYGTPQLAAAAFVNSLFLVGIVLMMGFAGGITPLVGAAFGRGAEKDAGTIMRSGLILNITLSVGLTILMSGVYFLLPWMGQEEALLPLIRSYYRIILLTMIPMSIFNCCQQTANGLTDTATAMWIMIGGNILNIIGNYILIFGHFGAPELGLDGAGISTLTVRWLMAAVIVAEFALRRRYGAVRRGCLTKAPRSLYGKVWRTSYPIMVQSGVECMLWSFGAVVCGWFGALQLASYQVVNTIGQLGFMIYMSFAIASSIRVANFTGVHDVEGVKRTAIAGLNIIMALATIASAFFLTVGSWIVSLFTSDPLVEAAAMPLIIPLVLYQYCDAVQLNYANALRGTSEVKPLLWVSVISYIIIGVPVLLFLACTLDMGNIGVYYSFSAALLAAAIMLRYYFRKTVARLEHVSSTPEKR